jgi:peptidoglycan/xylan/chitin deacetylase (PgdA/CDA1 family)
VQKVSRRDFLKTSVLLGSAVLLWKGKKAVKAFAFTTPTSSAAQSRLLLSPLTDSSTMQFSDDFHRADGPVDNNWIGAGAAIQGNKLVITPILGVELLVDPSIENWSSDSVPGLPWHASHSGSSSVSKESKIVKDGEYSARLDIDASNSTADIYQPTSLPAGAWVLFSGYIQASAAKKSGRVQFGAYNVGRALAPGTDWMKFVETLKSVAQNDSLAFLQASAASASLYIDNLSVKTVTYNSLFASHDYGNVDPIICAAIHYAGFGKAGVVMNLDDPNNPQNYVCVYYDGASIKLSKFLNQAETNIFTFAVSGLPGGAWIDGELLELRKNGTTYSVYYCGAKVSTSKTIDDTAILDNRYVGLFANAPSSFDSFDVYPNIGTYDVPDLSEFDSLQFTYPAGGAILSLRFDDNDLKNYTITFPLLTARNLVAGFSFYRMNMGNPAYMTLARMLEMQAAGMEIMCHSFTHGADPVDYDAFVRETALPVAEMRRLGLKIWTFVQPGGWVGANNHYDITTTDFWGTPEDLLLRAHFKSYMAYIPLGHDLPIAADNRYGLNHDSGTTSSLDALIAWVDYTIAQHKGRHILFHSQLIGTAGNISWDDFTSFLDYIKVKVATGALTLLTPTGQLFAQPV